MANASNASSDLISNNVTIITVAIFNQPNITDKNELCSISSSRCNNTNTGLDYTFGDTIGGLSNWSTAISNTIRGGTIV